MAQINTLIIEQVITGSNEDRRFLVKNDRGEQIFSVVKSPKWMGYNAFEAIVLNNTNQVKLSQVFIRS